MLSAIHSDHIKSVVKCQLGGEPGGVLSLFDILMFLHVCKYAYDKGGNTGSYIN